MLSDITTKVTREFVKNKKPMGNPLYKLMRAQTKGTPEYYGRMDRMKEFHEVLINKVDAYNRLPWYKKVFVRSL